MVFLVFLTAALIATNPPKIVKMFPDERSCLAVAEELNAYPQVNTAEAIKAGMGFICLKPVDNTA